jgi:predicted Zn-dependent peptidase
MDGTQRFEQHLLSSGVQLVGQHMQGVESAAIGFLIGTGARDEQPGQFGVSHFTEQMLFRGTDHLDARALSDKLDALGISYDTSTGIEMTLVSAVLLGTRVASAMELLADVVRYPAFPEDDVESVRSLILQERRQREDRPAQMVMESLRQEFFTGSPISHDVLGSDDTLAALGRQDLRDYWLDRYTANNMIVSIAGNFDWDAVLRQLDEITEAWSRGRGRMQLQAPTPRRTVRVIQRDAAQENIGFAFPGVSMTDPRYYSLALAIQALGGSSSSRLFQEVREKRGLAYTVQARFDGLEKIGLVRIYCGTSADRAHESVEVILDELRRFEADGITQEELALSKTRLKSQLIMRSESTGSRMMANLRSWWFEERLRTLEEIKERIDGVTVDDIAGTLRDLQIADTMAAVAVGPRSEQDLFGGVLARS